ncbi:MAG: hypothetical protein HRU40_20975 [Saprospiraceae bacterium]|nr:hypothetical protein [Alteromonadaceae bacterium]NRB65458.1 hypothetical protein [Saprospiraceae bacterium]
MNKLSTKSALSRRNKEKKEKITTVSSRRNTTTGTSPIPIRLSPNDKANIDIWLNELSDLAGKRISLAKLIRGLVHIKNKINNDKLLDAIKDSS